jgi:hypothetical protein
MKKICCMLLLLFCQHSDLLAKIRRVGFFAQPLANTDYTNITAAVNASANTDTILVFPNVDMNITLTKRLTIFGPGYFLDAAATPRGNSNQQSFPGIATISQMIFNAGSQNSVVMGFNGGIFYINTDSITIQRNRDIVVYVSSASPALNTSNLRLLQNYRLTVANFYSNASTVSNMLIANNLINAFSLSLNNTYSGLLTNNVWAYDNTQNANSLNGGSSTMSTNGSIELGAGAFVVQNNIFCALSGASAGVNTNFYHFGNSGNSVFNYNMALQASSGLAQTWGLGGTGNVVTPFANASNIFLAWPLIGTTSADARYQLKAGSPALTVGVGGTAIGMFAGNFAYKLSGLPPIPSIYSLTSPQGNNPTGNTLQLNISTKGNN